MSISLRVNPSGSPTMGEPRDYVSRRAMVSGSVCECGEVSRCMDESECFQVFLCLGAPGRGDTMPRVRSRGASGLCPRHGWSSSGWSPCLTSVPFLHGALKK